MTAVCLCLALSRREVAVLAQAFQAWPRACRAGRSGGNLDRPPPRAFRTSGAATIHNANGGCLHRGRGGGRRDCSAAPLKAACDHPMNPPSFVLERFFAQYEFSAKYQVRCVRRLRALHFALLPCRVRSLAITYLQLGCGRTLAAGIADHVRQRQGDAHGMG